MERFAQFSGATTLGARLLQRRQQLLQRSRLQAAQELDGGRLEAVVGVGRGERRRRELAELRVAEAEAALLLLHAGEELLHRGGAQVLGVGGHRRALPVGDLFVAGSNRRVYSRRGGSTSCGAAGSSS